MSLSNKVKSSEIRRRSLRTFQTLTEPWNDIPPALLNRINLTLQPIVVELGPATAFSRFGISRPIRPAVKFKPGLTRQARLFWGKAVLQAWNNQYTLMILAMTYAAMIETAPEPTKLDPNGSFPLSWMRQYQNWCKEIKRTLTKLDKYVMTEQEDQKK